MRYLIYSLLVSVFITSLFSCTDSKQSKEEEKVALMKANWSDTTALAKAIDVYYKDSVFKKGEIALGVRDAFIRSKIPYHYLQLHKIYRPKFKLSSPTVGYMPVLMLSGNDSAIVDFQITWQQPNVSDSVGQFVVTDNFLQTISNTPRYEWVEEDNYWIRKNVEIPQEIKTSKSLKMNQPKEIQIQEEEVPKKGK